MQREARIRGDSCDTQLTSVAIIKHGTCGNAMHWGEAVCSTGAHTCRGSDILANFLMGPPPRDGSVRGSCCMSAPDPVIVVL